MIIMSLWDRGCVVCISLWDTVVWLCLMSFVYLFTFLLIFIIAVPHPLSRPECRYSMLDMSSKAVSFGILTSLDPTLPVRTSSATNCFFFFPPYMYIYIYIFIVCIFIYSVHQPYSAVACHKFRSRACSGAIARLAALNELLVLYFILC